MRQYNITRGIRKLPLELIEGVDILSAKRKTYRAAYINLTRVIPLVEAAYKDTGDETKAEAAVSAISNWCSQHVLAGMILADVEISRRGLAEKQVDGASSAG